MDFVDFLITILLIFSTPIEKFSKPTKTIIFSFHQDW